MVLDDLKLISAKTKEVADILSNLKLDKSVLLVLPEVNEDVFRLPETSLKLALFVLTLSMCMMLSAIIRLLC